MVLFHFVFLPEFLTKNQTQGSCSSPIAIKPLSPLLESDDLGVTLCPVRKLEFYLKKSRPLRSPALRRLFISVNFNYDEDIAKITIAG